jgi:DNA-binding NarL/FixJ family response regulator
MPLDAVSAPILVGRQRELAAIDDFLAIGGGTLLLAGEAGIGKSRLVRTAIDAARARGFRVVQGASFDRDQALPYAPFLELIRSITAPHPEDTRQRLAATPGIRRLLPEHDPGLPAPHTALDPEREQRRLFHEMETLLAGLAAAQPLLVVLEDIHWSDETSFGLMLHLTRRAASAPLALLMTYRDDERNATLRRLLADIDRGRLATEITLRPLTPAETERQIRAILDLPRPAGPVFVRSLHSLTGGNPFFVEEVLRSLIAEGDVYPVGDGWQRKPLDQLRVPRSIDDAVARRSALLGTDAAAVLTLAAVAGQRVDFALLLALSGLNEDALLTAIKELIATQLIIEVSADHFAFRHALTRQAVYTGLLGRERRALHARVVRCLADQASAGADAVLEDFAYHHFEAGEWQRAQELSRAAGDRARALYAPQAAAEHYSRAIAALTHLGGGPDATLLLARAQAFAALGDFDAARDDFASALAAAEASDDAPTALNALLDLGLLWSGRDYEQAHAWLLRAVDLARSMADPAALAHALNRLGNWHANHEDVDEALRCHDEALAIFARRDDRRGLAETFDLLAMTHNLGGDLGAAEKAARRAITLFEELGDRQGLAGALPLAAVPAAIFEMTTLVATASLDESIANVERSLALAREIDWRSGEAFLLAILGEAWAAAGEFGRSLALLEECLAIADEIDHRQWLTQAHASLASIFGAMQARTRERAAYERVLALARGIHSSVWINTGAAGLASALCALGETDAAHALLSDVMTADAPVRTHGQRLLWTARAELALAQGQPQDALAIIDRLYATARNLTAEANIPRLAQLKAAALADLGDFAEAEALLRAAQATADADGSPPTLLMLHGRLAAILNRQGQHDAALAEEAAAREIAARLAQTIPAGELRDEFMCSAGLTASNSAARQDDAAASADDHLTPREREVATHVAAGRTNREIAEHLFVSERTVEAHVSNILRKLGVTSRASIATWAARRDLTSSAT